MLPVREIVISDYCAIADAENMPPLTEAQIRWLQAVENRALKNWLKLHKKNIMDICDA